MRSPPELSHKEPSDAAHHENAAAPVSGAASFVRVFKEIGWAFIGIGKNRKSAEETGRITPLRLIAVAIVALLLFVLGLIAVVHTVVPR